MRDLMATEGYSLPVLLAQNSFFGEYGVRNVPALVAFDQNGQPVKTVFGPVRLLELSRILDDLTGG